MDDIVIQLIARWGLAGVMMIVSGYIIWDSWRRNKRTEDWCQKVLLKENQAVDSRGGIQSSVQLLREELQQVASDSAKFRTEIQNRISVIEEVIANRHLSPQCEADRMEAIAKVAPSINAILLGAVESGGIDHIALALFHNGTQSLAGIPYIKAGVIAEKFKPMDYPDDVELMSTYRDENIMKYNKLPATIIQKGYVCFDLVNDDTLAEIDAGTFSKCRSRGIKSLAFASIYDSHGLCTGCVIAYNFSDNHIKEDELVERTKVIENLYQAMLKGFE